MSLPSIQGTRLFGHLDEVEIAAGAAYACGWAFDADNPGEPCIVSIYQDDLLIGRGAACRARPDVAQAGAPSEQVGFRIRIRARGRSRSISAGIPDAQGRANLLGTIVSRQPLPEDGLTEDDVISAFRLLLGREPENQAAIDHMLAVHPDRTALFKSMFGLPEFHEKNMDLVALVKSRIAR